MKDREADIKEENLGNVADMATGRTVVGGGDTDLGSLAKPGRKKKRKDADLYPESHSAEATADGGGPAPTDEQEEKKKKGKMSETIISILSGNILSKSEVTRAYPYMIFVAVLAFIYIANVFRTQAIYREYSNLTEQVKELRAKSMTIASDKMRATRQSRVMIELSRRDIPLRESLTPNKVIPKPVSNEEAIDRQGHTD